MYKKLFLEILILLAGYIENIHSQFMQFENIESYKPCFTDRNCEVNAFCFGNDYDRVGVCKCLDGYELWRNRSYYECFKAKKAGEACIRDYHCQVELGDLGECEQVTRHCTCKQGIAHVGRDGKCYKTAKLTEFCLSDDNCLLSSGKYAFCSFGHCACNLKERPTVDKRDCIPSKDLGEACTADSECQAIPNAVCRGICECSVGSTISMDGLNCLKAATEFGQPCKEDEQCSKFLTRSVCANGTCGCYPGYHSYLNTCFVTLQLGIPCQEKGECLHEPSFEGSIDCKEGVCACIPGAKHRSCISASGAKLNHLSKLFIVALIFLCKLMTDFIL